MLIGNWHYPDDPANLPDLKGPLNDVSRLAAALSDPHTGLFASNDINTAAERPSHEISYAVESFFSEAGREEVLLFYYSGHGLTDERGALLLCGRNSRSDRKRSTTIPAEEISGAMALCPAAAVIVILDCCYSGAFKNGEFASEFAGRGRFVLASCRPRDRAQDAQFASGLSRFTGHLLDGLRGDGAQPGSVFLTASDLYRYVHARLGEDGMIPVRHFTGEGDIAIARVLTEPQPGGSAPAADDEQTTSTLTISESLIELIHVEDGELLPVERIYVTARTRGGYPAPWIARTDADWVGLGIYPDRLEITLTPPAATSRANVEIRNQETGAARTVRILVTSRPDVAGARRPVDDGRGPASSRAPHRRQPKLLDKQRLCDAFLALPGMRDNDLRSLYVRELEAGRGRPLKASRYADARHDVWSIVDTCLQSWGSLRALAQIVAVFHGDSEAIRELMRLVDEFDGEPADAGSRSGEIKLTGVVEPTGPADMARPEREPAPVGVVASAAPGPLPPPNGDPPPAAEPVGLSLADEFFLISHQGNGNPLLGPDVLGAGLGGAVLADLLVAGAARLDNGLIVATDGVAEDAVGAFLVGEMRRYQDAFPPVEWIKSMHRDLLVRVIQRLVTDGLLVRLSGRLLTPRWRTRYRFTDVVRTSQPSARLAGHLIAGTAQPDARTAMLAALANVTGLYRALPIEINRHQTHKRAAAMAATLPADLAAMVGAVDLAIAHLAVTVSR